MPLPKVIATDLDGTLLGRDGRLSPRNQKALQTAREHGVLTVAVTARAPRAVYRVPELSPVLDAAICCTGAIVYDTATRTADFRHPIPLDTARELHERLRAALPGALFAVETGERQVAQSTFFQQGVHYGDPWTFLEPGDDLIAAADAVAELIVRVPGSNGTDMYEATRGIELPGVGLWHWGSFPEIECTAAEATKGLALASWCADRGVDAADVIAFGDMPNDVSMLAWAGRSYAMGGAHPDAVAAADDRTGPAADDGVAQVIEAILELEAA
ncbi:HAD family hydrolase [Glycomyces albidus]|uniref:HAD-IIB family hydrolase n=1 Tax=Glycomyces albidus TaxID=2656774 RepID=A0A6L5GE89_9ACTN|nr:HAD family hydrolase [Glycomyces albidus]MQM28024.1 HAD-IIB family hydrolase [Glycomyces albidus]